MREALAATDGVVASPSNLTRLAKAIGEEAARWGVQQWRLRAAAGGKFVLAREMLFTAEALEQASHEAVAAYHASLFDGPVLDATAGIGADSIALAKRGPLVACELDVERRAYLEWNLGVHGSQAEIRGDCFDVDWPAAVFADPARRAGGVRTFDPRHFVPDPLRLRSETGAIKLSALLHDAYLGELGPTTEFVSLGRECREALVRFGVQPGFRAVHVESRTYAERDDEPEVIEEALDYLFDPDPALVRAHAQRTVAPLALGAPTGYLTSDDPEPNPWGRWFRVLDQGHYDLKRIRGLLRQFDAATPILKQRGSRIELERVRRDLISQGEHEVQIAFWAVGRSIRFAILQTVEKSP